MSSPNNKKSSYTVRLPVPGPPKKTKMATCLSVWWLFGWKKKKSGRSGRDINVVSAGNKTRKKSPAPWEPADSFHLKKSSSKDTGNSIVKMQRFTAGRFSFFFLKKKKKIIFQDADSLRQSALISADGPAGAGSDRQGAGDVF